MKPNRNTLMLVIALIAVLTAVGCNRSPLDTLSGGDSASLQATVTGPVQISARVQTITQATRMLKFANQSDSVKCEQSCTITRYQNGVEVAMQFGEIKVDDSLNVYGNRQQNQLVNAYRIRVCTESDGGMQLGGLVRTMDQARRKLTLQGKSDTIEVPQSCQVIRQQNGGESSALYAQVRVGDSIEVTGVRVRNGLMTADRLRICGNSETRSYDVAFRDTIVTIDYSAGTLTVKNRAETIVIDEETFIFGAVGRVYQKPNIIGDRNQGGSTQCDPTKYGVTLRDTSLVITDLAVGDVIEVRARVVDATTLLAVRIVLATSNDVEKKCLEFTARLAGVDLETRVVTFEGLPWIGTVCPGAELLGLDGQPLTLSDFAVGDAVLVKGFPGEDDQLKVCSMILTTI